MFSRLANVVAMKERDLSITRRSRQVYRRWTCSEVRRDGQLQDWPLHKTVHNERKLSIRWEKPQSWDIPIRAAHPLGTVGS
jgi:hypothetical protein